MKKNLIGVFLTLGLWFVCAQACEFTILNDTSELVVVVDPNNHQLVVIAPGGQKKIDPSIPGLHRYRKMVPDVWPFSIVRIPETLDIYIGTARAAKGRGLRVVENYCSEEANIYAITQLKAAATNRQMFQRINVTSYIPYAAKPHQHGAHVHSDSTIKVPPPPHRDGAVPPTV